MIRNAADTPRLRKCARVLIRFPIRAWLHNFLRLGDREVKHRLLLAIPRQILSWMKSVFIFAAQRGTKTFEPDRVAPAFDVNGMAAFQVVLENAEPIRASTSGCLVTCCGALYPGGAERQVVNTLRGLAHYGLRDRLLMLADHLTPNQPQRYDFYLSMLHETNIAVREIRCKTRFIENFAADYTDSRQLFAA